LFNKRHIDTWDKFKVKIIQCKRTLQTGCDGNTHLDRMSNDSWLKLKWNYKSTGKRVTGRPRDAGNRILRLL
jgi:hypothetical protein